MNRRLFLAGSGLAAVGSTASMQAPGKSGAGPGFHLGAVTYNTLKDFDVPTIIRVLEEAGFEAVELRTTHKHGVEPSLGAQERLAVRRRLHPLLLKVCGICAVSVDQAAK